MTAVILAGGRSSRMGRDKLKLEIGGEQLLTRMVRRFSSSFDRVLVSVGTADRYPELGDSRVEDLFPGMGPMAGLHAALQKAGEDVFLVGGDMPYATPEAALRLIGLAEINGAAIVTLRNAEGRPEPLFGFYRYPVLPEAEELLRSGKQKMGFLLQRCGAATVTAEELGENGERLLRNLNEPEDYQKLLLEWS